MGMEVHSHRISTTEYTGTFLSVMMHASPSYRTEYSSVFPSSRCTRTSLPGRSFNVTVTSCAGLTLSASHADPDQHRSVIPFQIFPHLHAAKRKTRVKTMIVFVPSVKIDSPFHGSDLLLFTE